MGILDALKGVADIGKDTVAAGKSIGATTKMVNEYKAASSPAAKAPAPKPPAQNSSRQYGDRPGEQRIDTSSMTKPLGSYKKGGKVKKTGVYKLHAKERVLNAKQTMKFEKKGGLAALAGKK